MKKFECTACGGSLAPLEGSKLYICEYCGKKQPVPEVDEEKLILNYNRANRMRLNADFDRAYDAYDKIIAECPDDSEAYWEQCLCKFGIQYVKDPETGEMKPTVHRVSFDKMRKDALYELALDYADETQCSYYQREAKEIDRIMSEILSISGSEEPYDIFICYKENDELKNRTPDSVIAQDIYTALTDKGYKVFFARITLKEELGQQYEPYIFAALNSARLMLTVGTDYEYFNAAWVKNEWSRFLKLMAADKTKRLVPCYKDMEPEDMPDEIKGLESQNMGVLGAMQDLLYFIDKFFARDKKEDKNTDELEKNIIKEQAGSSGTGALLERAFMFLEDGRFKDADEYCERVLDLEPKCAKAYLGKLMAELGIRTEDKLKDAKLPFDNKDNCVKACRFDSALAQKLKADNAYIRECNETARKQSIYDKASRAAAEAKTDAQFNAAAAEYETIPGFKDADERAADCRKKAEEARLEAERKAEEERLEAERKAEEARLEAEEERLEAERRKREFELKVESVAAALKNADIKSEQQALETQLAGLRELLDGFDAAADRLSELKTEAAALQKKCDELPRKIASLGRFKKKEKSGLSAELSQAKAELDIIEKERAEIVSHYSGFGSKEKLAAAVKAKQTELDKLIERKNSKTAEYSFAEAKRLCVSDEQLRTAIVKKYPELLNDPEFSLIFAKAGGFVTLGSYPQTADGTKKPIEWLVLERTDKTALLVSKYGLDCKKYNDTFSNVTWESCSLRRWLNGEFLNTAFTPAHQSLIALSDVSADKNPKYSTSPGKTTKDKIFLLSIPEAEKYFKTDESCRCAPTAYSKARGAYTSTDCKTTDGEAACWWWLRSPGSTQRRAASVSSVGSVIYRGYFVDNLDGCVRPAFRISFDS